ncbi:MAG: M1 family aminopeptidase [Bacilli bacterium]
MEEVTAHEIAHQWWYGLVGNDEINEAWLDEGLTQYSTMMYYEKTYGKDAFENKIIESEQYYETAMLNLRDELGDISEEIDRPAYAFENWRLYDVLTYDRAAMMLHTVRETVGEKKFFSSMAYYFEQNKYKNASQEDFVAAFKAKSGINIMVLLESWLDGKVVQPAA